MTTGGRFLEVAKLITENGGRVVDLDEPKLTHVVIDKRDDSRRVELIKRTSKSVVMGDGIGSEQTWNKGADGHVSLPAQAEAEAVGVDGLHSRVSGRGNTA